MVILNEFKSQTCAFPCRPVVDFRKNPRPSPNFFGVTILTAGIPVSSTSIGCSHLGNPFPVPPPTRFLVTKRGSPLRSRSDPHCRCGLT